MPRIIKFRVWDKDTNRFFGWPISIDYWIKSNGESQLFCEINQFTGLQDKNGVDIYEGDIIYAHLNESKYQVKFGNYYTRGYDEKQTHIGFYILSLEDNFIEEIGHDGDIFKVIGNIYENPELLK